jgi:hypothetical protein
VTAQLLLPDRPTGLAGGLPVVMSNGLGWDSAAYLARVLLEPETRDYDLQDLVVLTAQTGDEWPITKHLAETYMYPLLAEHQVRTVQVARAGRYERDGYVVLDDTRTPTICHTEGGPYRLSDEMLAMGTVPQYGGRRKCSLKFKGFALDQWIAAYTQGQPYRHIIGFEANETRRIAKDLKVTKKTLPGRIPEYPLHAWNWDRETCGQYLLMQFGAVWAKSACTYCPFALSAEEERRLTIQRYIAEPEIAMLPMRMEFTSIGLNPKQSLIKGKHLINEIAATPGSKPLMAEFTSHLDQGEWSIYQVRRAHTAKKGDRMKRGTTYRSLVTLDVGRRASMLRELERRAARLGVSVQQAGRHHRVVLEERGSYYPQREAALVLAPTGAIDKDNDGFAKAWATTPAGDLQLSLT